MALVAGFPTAQPASKAPPVAAEAWMKLLRVNLIRILLGSC